ncbi:stress responsive alpha-beta barrel domain-containing protein [Pseudomonas fluorescens]|uniref:Stress responsive alpha-beta barrel domain-containing protein n=1 Tax=Pseudomonas fluorescens TaxID=294 RepID=A0A379IF59_PSEFL|nr:Dabb family protein [Pseudomonas fluorescens]SUD31465.1 stress responsive alpha-beta barrel domain-containing protein [Pseudomonas fluorescens]
MIKHIVMWKTAGKTREQRLNNAHRVKSAFEGLRGKIPGLLVLEIGIDISQIDYACDVVLYTEFTDTAALTHYATHAEHMRVRDELEGLRISRHQVDYLSDNAVEVPDKIK